MRVFNRFVPYRDRDLCFVDIETTGTNPKIHELTEIGIVHTRLGALSMQIMPRNLDDAEPEALKISGFNKKDWHAAPTFSHAAPKLFEYFDGATIIGHNISGFDIPMLEADYDRNGIPRDGLFRDAVDTMQLARTFLVPLGLNMLSLKACMKFFGVPYEGAHNAREDAEFTKVLYERITESLKWHGKVNGQRIQESLF